MIVDGSVFLNCCNLSFTLSNSDNVNDKHNTQIDLLFDRNDDVITLCEMKYTDKPFAIDKAYAKTIQQKKDIFTRRTKTKKQLFFSFVSAHGLKKTMYSEELVDGIVTLDDLFL